MRTACLAMTTAILAAFAPSAQAQDSWTGLYAGGAVGNLQATGSGVSDESTMASIIAGYNMDLGNQFVIGLEGDLTSDEISRHDFVYTLRPRAGYKMFNDAGLAFGTVGYGGTQISGDNPEGWTFGLGYEHQLTEALHLRAEYLYSEHELDGLTLDYDYLRAGLTTKF